MTEVKTSGPRDSAVQLSPEHIEDLVPTAMESGDNADLDEEDNGGWVNPGDAASLQQELCDSPAVPIPVSFSQGLAEWAASVSIYLA